MTNNMKKLLIDVNSVVPFFINGRVSGIGRTTLELVEALSKLQNLPFKIELYSQNMKGIGAGNIKSGFKTHHLYLPNRDNVNKILARIPIRETLFPCDLLHITSNFAHVKNPEQCVVTLHDALFMKMEEKAFNHAVMRREVPPFIQRCKHVITCSENSKKDIIETMYVDPEKVSVIYWGVKHNVFFPKQVSIEKMKSQLSFPLQGSSYFLSVSCNNERKRTNVLVESYFKYCEQMRPLNDLVLVWNNPPQGLKNEVEERGLTNIVHFLTNISDENLALLYNGATALFFPSAYEGFGLPILEAMACGTPVVTCKNSSLEEVGGDAAIYLNEHLLKESMCITMKKLESGEIALEDYRQKCIAQANKFTWKNTAEQYVQIYQQLLNS